MRWLSEDEELELWRRRKLLEMRRRLLLKQTKEEKKEERERTIEDPKETLKRVFVGRAWEIWRAAERQYPRVTEELAAILARLVKSGGLRGSVSGEQLYWLFERLGLRVRLETKIRILESGELKTIAEKLRGERKP